MDFPFNEQTDMLLVLGYCQGNCRESVRVYQERYPNRRIPNHKTFARIERRLRETGRLQPARFNTGRPRQARTPIAEEAVLQTIDNNPEISTRTLQRETGIPKSTVSRILSDQLIRPFHIQPVQELLPLDHGSRLNFAQIIRERIVVDDGFHTNILFTDESCFTRRGMTNLHNEHIYADENPHAIKGRHYQREFKINVWVGIIGNFMVGPFRLPDRLDGASYLRFLQEILPELLEDLPLNLRLNMFFMHDGAPPHFARAVREYLNEQFAGRWIGRGQEAPIQWPPRSPDLNPCDFFIWGALKTKVYEVQINNAEQLWNRIQNAVNALRENDDVLRRVHFNFLRRVDLCINEGGGHIEHLLSTAN